MARQCVDCRDYPSESGCDLTICSDNEEHLIDAAVIHAQTVHGETDTPELREMTRKSMKLESSLSRAA
jgi:predicted small metal-binding protein